MVSALVNSTTFREFLNNWNPKPYSSYIFQVIKAFGNPEFLNMVFPLLFDLSNSEPVKPAQTPLISDSAEAGYAKF